jgi:prepilin-type N-terminal cleavage/methylation domain-containing protein
MLNPKLKFKAAFTLIELLIVIAIIGLLVTLSILALSNARLKSRDAKRVADVKQLQTAMDLYYDANDKYPTLAEFQSGSLSYLTPSGTTTYISVPTAPSPADNACTDANNSYIYSPTADRSSYTLSFCLGSQNNSLVAGLKRANPAGICSVDCNNKVCGDDQCGGSCGTCDTGQTCSPSGQCACAPNCSGKNCGDDGCGGTCGSCTLPQTCGGSGTSGQCGCTPNCSGKNCGDDGCGGTCGTCVSPQSCGADGTCGVLLNMMFYGGAGSESGIYKPAYDDSYIYVAGSSASAPAVGADAVISKYDKNTLALIASKMYGGTSTDSFGTVFIDGSYLYVIGYTGSEGNGYGAILYKFDKNLGLISRKILNGSGTDEFTGDIVGDGQYLYIAGYSASPGVTGTGTNDILVMKVRENDLGIEQLRFYGGTGAESVGRLLLDGDNLYLSGATNSEGAGGKDTLLLKINKNDFTMTAKVYGSSADDLGYWAGMIADQDYLYLSGQRGVVGSRTILIMKIAKNDMHLVAQKNFGGSGDYYAGYGSMSAIIGNYIYFSGITTAEGNGFDTILLKCNKDDLSQVLKKNFHSSGNEAIGISFYSNGYFYMAANDDKKGAGGNDWVIAKLRDLPIGTVSTTPPDFTISDSSGNFSDVVFQTVTSSLTYKDAIGFLTWTDSALTLRSPDPAWTATGPFIIP